VLNAFFALGQRFLAKKQCPPCAKISRSSGFVDIGIGLLYGLRRKAASGV
jgi:hypothetical protein